MDLMKVAKGLRYIDNARTTVIRFISRRKPAFQTALNVVSFFMLVAMFVAASRLLQELPDEELTAFQGYPIYRLY